MKMKDPAMQVIGVGIGVAIAIGNCFSRISIPSPDRDSDPDYLLKDNLYFRSSFSRTVGAPGDA
jgi:hypothetical protein